MDKVLAFVKANLSSWTVTLGIVSGVLVALSGLVPGLDALLTSVWPAGKPWLVVASMYLGRAIGLIKQVQEVASAVQGEAPPSQP